MTNLPRASKWFVLWSIAIFLASVTPSDAQGGVGPFGSQGSVGGLPYGGPMGLQRGMPIDFSQYMPQAPSFQPPDMPDTDDIGGPVKVPETPPLGGGVVDAITCMTSIVKNIIIGVNAGIKATILKLKTEPFPDSLIDIYKITYGRFKDDGGLALIAIKGAIEEIKLVLATL